MKKSYDKTKVSYVVAGIFAAVVLLFILFLYWSNQRVVKADVSSAQTQISGEIKYELNTKGKGFRYLKIDGYVYEKGISIDTALVDVLVYDKDKDEYYQLPTESVQKKKITKKENDGCNYDYCGFSSVVLRKYLPNGGKFYIRCRNNGKNLLIETEETIAY